MTKVLVTGALGFIGYHLVRKLLQNEYTVIGIDNISSYYDVTQKYDKLPLLGIDKENIRPNRLFQSSNYSGYKFGKIDVTNRFQIEQLFNNEDFDIIVNLAAQAGVQYSIKNPHSYVENNIVGFVNLLDAAKNSNVKHFLYASSSSVYGNRESVPFKESDRVDCPISLYAASKKANELMAYSYSHLYRMRTTGLRFFTVYGPWGRPDMAPFIFTQNIMNGDEIVVYNEGKLERDFTYIDDIINGVYKVISIIPENQNDYNIYNIGNSKPVNLMEFIKEIEKKLNKKANIRFEPLRSGDVFKTYASTTKLYDDYLYEPKIGIDIGLGLFIDWYIDYFK